MKHSILLYIIAVLGIATINSCGNKCEGINCGPNQQCAEGKCYCADGYEGDQCTTLANQKYVGKQFLVFENCQGNQSMAPQPNNVFIYQGNNISTIKISNFIGAGVDVTAIIRTDQANLGNTLEIPRQTVGGITVEGYGTYNTPQAGQIQMEVNYSYAGLNYSCQQRFYPN